MADKSELIIQAALKIFYQRGYGSISVEDIAREAKVAKGTIYLYFKDKDELFFRSVLYVIEFIEAQLPAEQALLRSLLYNFQPRSGKKQRKALQHPA